MNVVVKARIEHDFRIAEEEDDAMEEAYARRYAEEAGEAEEAEKFEEEVDDRRYAQEEEDELLREAAEAYHQRSLEEAMLTQQQPNTQYECSICEDAVGFDHRKCQGLIPYDCHECHDYYNDHRVCEGMTRSEIGYEDYLNGEEWRHR